MTPKTRTPPRKRAIQRARRVRLLLVGVDGVLTDGRIYLRSLSDGTVEEMKVFDVQDGAALVLARIVGIRTGLISGRDSPATARRALELGMDFVSQGRPQKSRAYETICRCAQVQDREVAYIGDDLPDLPILQRVGLAIAVANAAPEVKRVAHLLTRRNGGQGAVREAIEIILKAQGKWRDAIRAMTSQS